jgi:UDP-N-acetylmuramate--alanine ligase
MSALAKILLAQGESVCGSDRAAGSDLKILQRMGGKVRVGHAVRNLNHPDRVVYSSSIWPDNPELVAARNRGIPVLHRGQMLARLVGNRRTIAVTGAHGKSTVTGMTALTLLQAGLDPTVALGAEIDQMGGNARCGKGPYAVVEADESDGSFLWLAPTVAVITNLDEEHLDFFRNPGEILECYAAFAQKIRPKGTLVGCLDDPNVRRLFSTVGRRKIGYGLALDYAFVPFGALGTVDQISLKVKF